MATFNANFVTGGFGGVSQGRLDANFFGGASDTTAPTVSNVTPTPSTAIASSQAVGCDVTDAGTLRRVILIAEYPALGTKEVIHDGSSFTGNYAGTRTAISGGYRFASVLRSGGWPAAPTLTVIAYDISGNEA